MVFCKFSSWEIFLVKNLNSSFFIVKVQQGCDTNITVKKHSVLNWIGKAESLDERQCLFGFATPPVQLSNYTLMSPRHRPCLPYRNLPITYLKNCALSSRRLMLAYLRVWSNTWKQFRSRFIICILHTLKFGIYIVCKSKIKKNHLHYLLTSQNSVILVRLTSLTGLIGSVLTYTTGLSETIALRCDASTAYISHKLQGVKSKLYVKLLLRIVL